MAVGGRLWPGSWHGSGCLPCADSGRLGWMPPLRRQQMHWLRLRAVLLPQLFCVLDSRWIWSLLIALSVIKTRVCVRRGRGADGAGESLLLAAGWTLDTRGGQGDPWWPRLPPLAPIHTHRACYCTLKRSPLLKTNQSQSHVGPGRHMCSILMFMRVV